MFTLPDPLHPAIVHLPIALAVLTPLVAIAAWGAIRLGLLPARSWAAVVALQLALVLGGWAALETGEKEEERVERVVAERHIEDHEERAEGFETLAAISLLVMAAGLLPGRVGGAARIAAVIASVAVLAAGIRVGHSGGELVYRHGAAAAYTGDAKTNLARGSRPGHAGEIEDDD
jgi:uncharacterized membrane protein